MFKMTIKNNQTADVVTLGETMVLFQSMQNSRLQYASLFEKSLGGAESNVAIGLTRLGKKVRWISRLGADPFGDYIYAVLKGEGVEVTYVTRDKQKPTGVMFKESQLGKDPQIFYYRKSSAVSAWDPKELHIEMFQGAKLFHFTGITPALSSNCKIVVFHAVKLAKQAGLTISFDPNMRFKLWKKEEARQIFLQLLRLCDIVLPGIDEGKLITGESDPDLIAKYMLNSGPQLVIIKLGEKGAIAYTNDNHGDIEKIFVPGFPVKQVIDTVGAGDGFTAGFLSAYLDDKPLNECLKRANAVGAIVIQHRGDWEGLPSLEEVEQFISGKELVLR